MHIMDYASAISVHFPVDSSIEGLGWDGMGWENMTLQILLNFSMDFYTIIHKAIG